MLNSFYGNHKAKQTLVLGCKDGRLPHAMLLEGESGSGKKTFAMLLAAAAVCTGADKPCGVCKHCVKAKQGIHPDIMLTDGGASAKNVNVDAIRQLRATANVKPNEAQRKVYILADAQNMTVQAQNALLKVLEEPPKNVMFLLTCDNHARLLETIVSRVVLLRLELPTVEECVAALPALVPDKTPEEYRLAAQVFEGNIGRAAASLQEDSFVKVIEAADSIVQAAVRGTEYDLLCQLAAFEGDKEGFQVCLRRVKNVFMQVLRQKYGAGSTTGVPNQLENYVSALQCRQILDIIEEAIRLMEQNMGYALASAWLCSQIKATQNRA